MHPPAVDVLIPTSLSTESLAATLASLASQRYPALRVLAARPSRAPVDEERLGAIVGVLEARGRPVRLEDLPAATTPGQRSELLVERAEAPLLGVVEDGIFLEPDLIGRLVAAIRATGCGFVGSATVDLRYRDEHQPDEGAIDFWDGPVRPEVVSVGSPAWDRRHVHRGAILEHLRERLPRTRDRLYRIADIHGCVLYDRAALQAVGGFRLQPRRARAGALPPSRESAVQVRLLGRTGGAGLFPSGVYRLTPARTVGDPGAALAPDGVEAGQHVRRRRRAGPHEPETPADEPISSARQGGDDDSGIDDDQELPAGSSVRNERRSAPGRRGANRGGTGHAGGRGVPGR